MRGYNQQGMNSFRRNGWRGFLAAFGHAGRGVLHLLASQRNARFHAAAAVAAVALGWWLGISRGEWIAIALCIGFVFTAEALNSALEELADAVHPDRHPAVGRAKDLAAAAVLLAALAAAAAGLVIFVPRLVTAGFFTAN